MPKLLKSKKVNPKTPKHSKDRITLKKTLSESKVLEAIKGTGGIISSIARRLDVDWHTAEIHINKWPSTVQAFKDEREAVKDLAESTVISAIKNGDVGMAKWILSVLAKNRGFGEKVEISGAEGAPLFPATVTIKLVKPDGK